MGGTSWTTTAAGDGSWSITTTLLPGTWTATATATDAAGNASSGASRTFSTETGEVTGGGGCSCRPAGGASPASFLLLLLAIPFAPRRRRPAGR